MQVGMEVKRSQTIDKGVAKRERRHLGKSIETLGIAYQRDFLNFHGGKYTR
jgi:hypothetical protein